MDHPKKAKNRQKTKKNKIEGTLILKLAMIKNEKFIKKFVKKEHRKITSKNNVKKQCQETMSRNNVKKAMSKNNVKKQH